MVKRNYKSKKRSIKKKRYRKKRRGGSRKAQKGGFFNPMSFILDSFLPNTTEQNVPITNKTPLKGGSNQLETIRNNYKKLIR